jgi:AraC-like DNA-binding protein
MKTKHQKNFAQLWLPDFTGIELFQAHLMDYAFSKHFHETYTVGLNDRGFGQCLYRGTICNNTPGSFNLLDPGEVHTGQVADERGWSFRNIYISMPLMESLLAQMEWADRGLPHLPGPNVYDPSLCPLFKRLFQALNESAPLLIQQSLLLDLLSKLLSHHSKIGSVPAALVNETKAVTTVRSYLETHYADNISIKRLSNLVGLSPYYLIRSFRQQMGLPPHSYQMQVRLLRAKRALRSSQSLGEVAIDSGFFDQSHLIRCFKRSFGITPGQYRQGNSVQDN